MTFVGLDLHKRYITACALDEAGVLVAEVRQLATSIDQNRLLVVAHVERGDDTRIISARLATRRERIKYEEAD